MIGLQDCCLATISMVIHCFDDATVVMVILAVTNDNGFSVKNGTFCTRKLRRLCVCVRDLNTVVMETVGCAVVTMVMVTL